MSVVYLGLGSNIGNRKGNITNAVDLLNQNDIRVDKISSIIETDPVGPPQQKFLNAAIKATTALSPEELLKSIKEIEKKLGRIKTIHHGPRTIDIDILLYDDIGFHSENLTIPHPEMLTRNFVMTPLKEIYPEIIEKLAGINQ